MLHFQAHFYVASIYLTRSWAVFGRLDTNLVLRKWPWFMNMRQKKGMKHILTCSKTPRSLDGPPFRRLGTEGLEKEAFWHSPKQCCPILISRISSLWSLCLFCQISGDRPVEWTWWNWLEYPEWWLQCHLGEFRWCQRHNRGICPTCPPSIPRLCLHICCQASTDGNHHHLHTPHRDNHNPYFNVEMDQKWKVCLLLMTR